MAYIHHKSKEELQPVVAGGLGHYRRAPDAKVLSIFELQRTPRPRARPPAALSRDQPDSESRDRLAGRRTPGPGLRPRALILRRRITESRRDESLSPSHGPGRTVSDGPTRPVESNGPGSVMGGTSNFGT